MNFTSDKRYNDYSTFIKKKFKERVQKISINIGFSCPNRDGTKGMGGCTYCNNHSFNPDYCKSQKSVSQQIQEGISFFDKKYNAGKYFAYFQAYTNTYADLEILKKYYEEALEHPQVIGLVIGTRPDCINIELIEFLSHLAKNYFVSLELGVESTLDRTLNIVNRCHTYAETIKAYNLAMDNGIYLGAHIILGLPGESKEEILNHAKELSKLPIDFLKIHHLQIVKHTQMAIQYKSNPDLFHLFTLEEYLALIGDFISLLRSDIIIERFISESPERLLIEPRWNGMKNYEFVNRLSAVLQEKNFWQGKCYS